MTLMIKTRTSKQCSTVPNYLALRIKQSTNSFSFSNPRQFSDLDAIRTPFTSWTDAVGGEEYDD